VSEMSDDIDDTGAKVQGMLERLDMIGPDAATRVGERPAVWSYKRGSATVYVTAGADTVIVSSKVLDRAKVDDVELLRRLLQVNLFLKGAFFAVEDSGAVFLYQIYPIDGLEDGVFAFVLQNVGAQADRFDDIIQGRTWEKKQ
jgi:hypothetical protein